MKINKNQFIQLVSNINSEKSIIVKSKTIVKMNKRNNPYYDKIVKKNVGVFNIGFDYGEKMCKYNPEFVVGENKVGNHINKSILFNDNTQKHYLFCEPVNTIQTKFELNGEAVNRELFEKFLPKRNENPVKINSFCIDNVESVEIDGNEFHLED